MADGQSDLCDLLVIGGGPAGLAAAVYGASEGLATTLAEDHDGFLFTGADIPAARLERADYAPLPLETSRPGIFCVRDVRSRSVKRVATAIGEGSMAVRLVSDRLHVTDAHLAGPVQASTA